MFKIKKIFVLFLFLTLCNCATMPIPTESETSLINSGNIENPASKKELLQISRDLQKRIFELDKKETFSRVMAWATSVGIALNLFLAIINI